MRQTGQINNYELDDAANSLIYKYGTTRYMYLTIDLALRNLPATIHSCYTTDTRTLRTRLITNRESSK
jgi:hypothetical protein